MGFLQRYQGEKSSFNTKHDVQNSDRLDMFIAIVMMLKEMFPVVA
jgi:hypothetical protein